jgi:hypothetical protein
MAVTGKTAVSLSMPLMASSSNHARPAGVGSEIGDAPLAFPRWRGLGIRLIGRNQTMRRIESEEIAGHVGRNPLV